MSKQIRYSERQIYTLDQIRPVVPGFKMISNRLVQDLGIFYLYREKDTQTLWLGGPFRGKDSNLFLYLGPQKTKNRISESLLETLMSVLRKEIEGKLLEKIEESISPDIDQIHKSVIALFDDYDSEE